MTAEDITRSPSEPSVPIASGKEEGSLPPIRTMADDLKDVQRGVRLATPGGTSVARPSITSSPGPSTQPTASSASPRERQEKSIQLPTREPATQSGRSRGKILLVLLTLIILGGAVGASWFLMRPRGSGTIADILPAETLAFLSVRRGSGALSDAILGQVTEAFGISSEVLGSEWTHLAYAVFPGSSSAQPVAFLALQGASVPPDVSGTSLITIALPKNGIAIVPAQDAGRLQGIGNATLGVDRGLASLFQNIEGQDGLLFLRRSHVENLLSPFTFHGEETAVGDLLLALSAPTDPSLRGLVELTGTHQGSIPMISTGVVLWDPLLAAIPSEAVRVVGAAQVRHVFDAWQLTAAADPALHEVLRRLNERESALDRLASASGPTIVGVLPTASAGVRDGFTVIAITPDQIESARATLRELEESMTHLGPFLAGTPLGPGVIEETTYRDTPIRFINFGSPDRAFDYAFHKNMLLITTSRASMRLLIDHLDGIRPSHSSGGSELRQGPITASTWEHVRLDSSLLNEIPEKWRPLLAGITEFYLEPASDHGLFGALRVRLDDAPSVPSPVPLSSPVPSASPSSTPTASPSPASS